MDIVYMDIMSEKYENVKNITFSNLFLVWFWLCENIC